MSQRVLRIKPSATLAVDAKAKELKRQGKNVISFGSGEPDFTSPAGAMKYAEEAIKRGETHYTPNPGILELREEICAYYGSRFGLTYEPSQVVVASGAKPSIYEALAAIVDPGDEVVLMAPTWVSYIEQVGLVDGKTVIVDTVNNGFMPKIEDIEKALTAKTVALLLNSPSNPSGMMFNEEMIRQVGKLAIEHDLWVIWDEIYEQLVYDGVQHYNPVQLMPELKDRTIIINGVSKAYAMTGWRIGYSIAPKEVAAKISNFQSHLTSNPAAVSQWAALGAMRESGEDVIRMRRSFEQRRDLICSLLADMPHIEFPRPEGAFYVFVDIRKCLGKQYAGKVLIDDLAFCDQLLDSELVAVVPGSAFLTPGYIRLSYACSEETIKEGMKRLKRFLEQIK
ncbi:Aspartate transaminase [Syntrophobotulus glycolicus DSM 8271]|uniref:Aminotransferase n=2 Tax=Syntrophobotulus TaxID=51196 RepID=F0SY51_SYNGF|nr:Aspartate transaminase [Syntrophobotulus glycolicus DSM 8271]